MHKEKVDKVPNSISGRNNIEIEIYGMEGIPEEDLREHERQMNNRSRKYTNWRFFEWNLITDLD